jgi:putative tricarboxylic transport membrane protein
LEILNYLELGIITVFTSVGLFYVVIGLLTGIIFAAIPGLSGLMAIILMTPFSYNMSAINALILFSAVYVGSNFGGSISAILVNIPGSAEAICTTYDGYPMTQKGQAGKALATSMTCSAIGGVLSVFLMILFSPLLAKFALKFTPVEFFSLVMMGLFVVSSVSGDDIVKGLIPMFFGILLGCVGMAPRLGVSRFDFDFLVLQTGLEFISVMLGIFVVGEVFVRFVELTGSTKATLGKISTEKLKLKELWRIKGTIIKSFFIGSTAGLLPGLGVILAIFTSYSMARQSSPHPEKFGTGVLEGVAAPETANNASAGGAMIPLLTMGIPGSAVTAVLLGVLVMHDIQPGPFVFLNSKDLVGAIFITMLIANLLILVTGRIAASGFSQFLKIHYAYLFVVVLVFSFLGCFSLRTFMFDPWVMFVFGIIGYLMRKLAYPIGPLVLGLVLGPIAEDNFLAAMELFDNNLLVLFTRPVSAIFLLAGAIIFLYPIVKKYIQKKSSAKMPSPAMTGSTAGEGTIEVGQGVFYILVLIVMGYLYSISNSYRVEDYYFGPEAWPKIGTAALMVLSLLRVITIGLQYQKAKKEGRLDEMIQPQKIWGILNVKRSLTCLILIAMYIAGIHYMGFITANIIILPVAMYMNNFRGKIAIVVYPIVTTIFASIVFYRYLYISLPKGIGFFQDISIYLLALIK